MASRQEVLCRRCSGVSRDRSPMSGPVALERAYRSRRSENQETWPARRRQAMSPGLLAYGMRSGPEGGTWIMVHTTLMVEEVEIAGADGRIRPWPVSWTAVWVGALGALAAAVVLGLIGVSLGADQ